MIAAECGGVRIICVYAPNGRLVGSPFYEAKLVWFDKLARWINKAVAPDTPAVIGGDFNVAPDDIDVWDPRACYGGTHVSEARAAGFCSAFERGIRRCVPIASPGTRAVHVVGLPRRQFL